MSDFYGRVTNEQNALTRLMSRVPGFKGYIERETRRSADKLLREAIASRYEEQWQRISRLQRELIGQGQIAFVDDLEAGAIKIRQFADRIRTAAYGYAGFFDAVRINEEELAALYEYDLQLLDQADEVSRAIDHIEAAIGTDGLPAAIRNFVTVTERSVETYNRRAETIVSMA